jgi:hypothetical protein
MRNSLKKRLFAHLYSILVISCTFTKKKPTFLLFLCGFLCNESGSFRPDDLFAPGRFAPESESIRPT